MRRAEIEKERKARWYAELESLDGTKVVIFYPKRGEREFRITRTDAIRAVEASVIQILKEKLDYRLEEILAPDKCDTDVHHTDDQMLMMTKCIGYAFGLHLHIDFVIREVQDWEIVLVTVETVEVGG